MRVPRWCARWCDARGPTRRNRFPSPVTRLPDRLDKHPKKQRVARRSSGAPGAGTGGASAVTVNSAGARGICWRGRRAQSRCGGAVPGSECGGAGGDGNSAEDAAKTAAAEMANPAAMAKASA